MVKIQRVIETEWNLSALIVERTPNAHLQPIPAFDEPFSKIIVDCVGPLPKTKSGHESLLTIMCASTCFSEAIQLRNIKTKNIER